MNYVDCIWTTVSTLLKNIKEKENIFVLIVLLAVLFFNRLDFKSHIASTLVSDYDYESHVMYYIHARLLTLVV